MAETTKAQDKIAEQKDKLLAEAKTELRKNAVDCTYYVAGGKVMAKDLADKYGVTLDDAQKLLAKAAVELESELKKDKAGSNPQDKGNWRELYQVGMRQLGVYKSQLVVDGTQEFTDDGQIWVVQWGHAWESADLVKPEDVHWLETYMVESPDPDIAEGTVEPI